MLTNFEIQVGNIHNKITLAGYISAQNDKTFLNRKGLGYRKVPGSRA
jgi:hypothetical protein